MIPTTRRRGRPRSGVLAALLILTAPCAAVAQEVQAPLSAALVSADSAISAATTAETIPGAVLLVARDGKVVYERAFGAAKLYDYGMRRLDRPEPMTAEHGFDLASVTKVMATTYAMMLLVDRGLIALDSPVYTYLPDFRGLEKDSITVRDLLTHRAGLYRWKPTFYHATNAAGVYAYIRDLPLEFKVHEGRHYSDLGFMLAGYIVERVSGKPLDTFLADELYGPLALAHTGFRRGGMGPAGPIAATSHGNPYEYRMVADDNFGYLCDEDPAAFTGWRKYTLQGEVNDGNSWYGHGGVAGHAGLFSSARELNVLLQVLLAGGMYGGRRIVSPETVGTFLTPDAFTGNGVGWAISKSDAAPAVQTFSHGGFTGTYVAGVPELGLAIVFLSNRQNVGQDTAGYYPNVGRIYSPVVQRIVQAAGTAARAQAQASGAGAPGVRARR